MRRLPQGLQDNRVRVHAATIYLRGHSEEREVHLGYNVEALYLDEPEVPQLCQMPRHLKANSRRVLVVLALMHLRWRELHTFRRV